MNDNEQQEGRNINIPDNNAQNQVNLNIYIYILYSNRNKFNKILSLIEFLQKKFCKLLVIFSHLLY